MGRGAHWSDVDITLVRSLMDVGMSAKEIHSRFQHWPRSSVFKLVRRLQHGWEPSRKARPRTTRTEEVVNIARAVVDSGEKISVKLLAGKLGLSQKQIKQLTGPEARKRPKMRSLFKRKITRR